MLDNRLEAFTIVESITAMVIILVSFGIGISIYLNIVSSDQLQASNLAFITLEQALDDTKKNNLFIDGSFEVNGLTIQKKIESYKLISNTYLITLKAFNQSNQTLSEIKEIIYLPD